MNKIKVKNIEISVTGFSDDDCVSLTDIAKIKNSIEPKDVVKNWMRSKSTLEFLGIWEILNNADFNRVEFDAFRKEAGKNAFVMTPTKWVALTNAIGIKTKSGKYGGGTFAHRDIA